MKIKVYIMIAFIAAFSFNGKAQCNDELLSMAINQLAPNFDYVKDIKVRLKKSKKKGPPLSLKQGVIFNKGQTYKIYARNAKEFDGELIFQLHNTRGVQGVSYHNGKHYTKGFTFKCSATGMYYLSCYYENGLEGCSVIVISAMPTKHELNEYLD